VVSNTPTGATATLSPTPPAAPSANLAAPALPNRGAQARLVTKRISAMPIGIVTAAGATALGLGAWALIGAVATIAKARGIRLSSRG